MKKLLLYFFFASVILFTSCDKEEPYSLAADLQNGYWEHPETGDELSAVEIFKFDTDSLTHYVICEGLYRSLCDSLNPACVALSNTGSYRIDYEVLGMPSFTLLDTSVPFIIKNDSLITGPSEDEPYIFIRKETLGYPDCN